MNRKQFLKWAILIILIFLSGVVLVWGIRVVWQHWQWLDTRKGAGLALLLLFGWLAATVGATILLRSDWKESTAVDVTKGYLARFGLMFGALAVLLIFTIVDTIMRQIPSVETSPLPLLCDWANVGHPFCVPGLFTFHTVYLMAAFVTIRYGDRVMDWLAIWHNTGMGWLDGRIEKSVNSHQ